jgi:hypothetical protein
MELDSFFNLLADYKQPDPTAYIDTNFEEYMRIYTNPKEFSDQILLNLPAPRIDWY